MCSTQLVGCHSKQGVHSKYVARMLDPVIQTGCPFDIFHSHSKGKTDSVVNFNRNQGSTQINNILLHSETGYF